ncbi:DUF423 domain-containing protein [Arenimonas fontis]|uniref:DUF423 domain-containing protein n=1 Tax=Arenimonas fontis TaxID=2608255 RepID=A0A5B2ZE82_9GAMM|nr:DUF423 domain-containing protein [Arenimonas fontis]KAA2286367.1 DUF423 domain-containing protein [Arenimonas fontis]
MARRVLAAGGAVACAVAVGLSAWASHGLSGDAARLVGLAAAFAFAHGLALALLAPRERLIGPWMLAAGLLLFAGSLLGKALAGWPGTLAPAGGVLLMAGWLVIAFGVFRRRD